MINPEEIRELIEANTGINLSTKTRKIEFVYARAIYFLLCREKTNLSLNKIGQTLGKDHATVLHAIKMIEDVYFQDPYFCNMYENIASQIKIQSDKHKTKVEILEESNRDLKIKYFKLKAKYEELLKKEMNEAYLVFNRIPKEKVNDFVKTRLEPYLKMNT